MKEIILLPVLLFSFLLANAQSFTCGTSSVTDIDGNVYPTVKIGSQCWMKENMRTTRYANGQAVGENEISGPILRQYINMAGKLQVQVYTHGLETVHVRVFDMMGGVTNYSDFNCDAGSTVLDFSVGTAKMYIVQINDMMFKVIGDDRNVTGVRLLRGVSMSGLKSDSIVISDTSRNYFDFDNDPGKGIQYGKLYTARSALNINSPPYPDVIQGICPDGWHVANDTDWMQLEMTAGMTHNQVRYMFEYRGTISSKLKIAGPEWYFGDGTDDFGFSAKGSGSYGCGQQGCAFGMLTKVCNWWTYNKDYDALMFRQLTASQSGVWRSYYTSDNGACSVRCVKNQV